MYPVEKKKKKPRPMNGVAILTVFLIVQHPPIRPEALLALANLAVPSRSWPGAVTLTNSCERPHLEVENGQLKLNQAEVRSKT